MDGVKVLWMMLNNRERWKFREFYSFRGIFKNVENTAKANLNKILWSKDCQVAFSGATIKKEICSPKILVHYDPSLPLTLASDASPVGIGCVLVTRVSRWL
ncbi:hypothetical protein TNCV_658801 [Trichonephila clavipes]|nr:hypothetical protein TNCV_658801 [Trichonephila clavipes]